jgi:hypothetical protein
MRVEHGVHTRTERRLVDSVEKRKLNRRRARRDHVVRAGPGLTWAIWKLVGREILVAAVPLDRRELRQRRQRLEESDCVRGRDRRCGTAHP